jgi:hypothetical protein
MSKMSLSAPSLSTVYQLAINFREATPWKWMRESDIFAVQSPVSGKRAYCCIMGKAGLLYALGIYDGDKGIQSLMNLQDSEFSEPIDQMKAGLEQELYKVAFENSEYITKEDKAIYKKLGLKFRGANQWVQILEWRAGYVPLTVQEDAKDLDLIAYALEQSLVVLNLFKRDRAVLQRKDDEILLRVPVVNNNQIEWTNQYIFLPKVAEVDVSDFINKKLLEKAKKLPTQKAVLCFSLQYMPNPIGVSKGDPETQPYFAKLALWIDYKSARIMGVKIYTPKSFKQDFTKDFFKQLHEFGSLPSHLLVNSEFAFEILEPMLEGLDTEVIFNPEVEVFEIIQSDFIEQFINSGF